MGERDREMAKTLDYFDLDVERDDMNILKRGGWFTDTIVSAYFKYVERDFIVLLKNDTYNTKKQIH